MISSSLLFIFIALVGLLWKLEAHPHFGRWFRVLPVPFWCYMIPMLGTTFGLLPAENPLYPFLSKQLLPICLVLLLIGIDLKGVLRLGPLATGLMLIGAVGTILGGLLSFGLYHRWLPEGTWAGIGALSASWIGGSANLIAVKEALKAPESVIAPIIVVDAVVAYSWMALLIWGSSQQERWQRWVSSAGGHREGAGIRSASAVGWGARHSRWISSALRASSVRALTSRAHRQACAPIRRTAILGALVRRKSWRTRLRFHSARACAPLVSSRPPPPAANAPRTPAPSRGLVIGIIVALVISLVAQWVASRLPTLGTMIGASTWTVLLVTTAALGLSLTRLNRLGQLGISKVGTFTLFVLLASIGARANLHAILKTPVFLLLGVTWILIHGACLILAGYFLKAPLGLIAAASQANIGGPISAPIVGATYHPELAGIGLLMAIVGNILGTYLGLATAMLARLIHGG